MNSAERLKFAIRFAETSLEDLDGAAWAQLRDHFVAFSSGGRFQAVEQSLSGPGNFQRTSGKALPVAVDRFASLQSEVRNLLSGILQAQDLFIGKQTEVESASVEIPTVRISALYYLRPARPPFTEFNESCVLGSERDVFLLALLDLLSGEPTHRLSRCPECQKIFVRAGKQLYCCRRCVNRANQRSWRQTLAGKKTNRKKAALGYEKRLKAKYPGAKVRRRTKD